MARNTMAVRLGAALAAAALTGAALSGCSFSIGGSGKPIVAKGDLQNDISERLAKAGEKPKSVTCKDDLQGEVGSIEVAKRADFVVLRSPRLLDLVRVGVPAIRAVLSPRSFWNTVPA